MDEFKEITDTLTTFDGLKLFYRKYQAENERAVLIISHGLGEHSGRYRNVVRQLLPKGITLFAYDQRGHGNSDGIKGHVLTFTQYITDLRMFIKMIKKGISSERKIFLLGHSMGGLIALYFAIQSPEFLSGIIASSPGLGMIIQVPIVKKIAGQILSDAYPYLTLSNEIDSTKLSHDVHVQRAYKNDPLVHNQVSARWFTEFMSAMEVTNKLASKLSSIPILMQVAGDDHLVNSKSSKDFFERLTAKDKKLYFYEELYHEIYNELPYQRAMVLSDLENWLESHI